MKEKVRFVIFEEPKLPVPKNAHHVTVPVTYIASCTTGNFGSSVCRVNVHTRVHNAANAECKRQHCVTECPLPSFCRGLV